MTDERQQSSSPALGDSTTGPDNAEFYWTQSRDSLLTPIAIQLFQIAAKHNGEVFDSAKLAIDEEYATVTGQTSERHGGKFQTAVQVYQEAGWINLSGGRLTITEAGYQALALLGSTPGFLRAVPYYVIDLLARFQLNNPARPSVRNGEIANLRSSSNVFPYWTIWKIMRECDDRITIEELQRFVFSLRRSEDIDATIIEIKTFRADKLGGLSELDLDDKYPARLTGANAEPKYWMGRAGAQIGTVPSLIEKEGQSTYVFNKYYLPLIDNVLANEPTFKEYVDENTWFAEYGRAIPIETNLSPAEPQPSLEIDDLLEENDPIAAEVDLLLEEGLRSFLLVGPPGTSKTWYARQLANRIVEREASRIRLVQFHPSYAYEDFIEGFVPETSQGGALPIFKRRWKVFAEVCDLARDDNFAVLVIDEFSRGDPGRIFGEALTYIEPEYRDVSFKLASGRYFSVPPQLVIIATMNPYDRSVSAVDVAMQRRFEIISMRPDEAILNYLLTKNGMDREMVSRVIVFFRVCQKVTPHGGLGHAYFLKAKDRESLSRIWRYNLAPLFDQELQFDDSARSTVEAAYLTMVAE